MLRTITPTPVPPNLHHRYKISYNECLEKEIEKGACHAPNGLKFWTDSGGQSNEQRHEGGIIETEVVTHIQHGYRL